VDAILVCFMILLVRMTPEIAVAQVTSISIYKKYEKHNCVPVISILYNEDIITN